MAGGRGSRLKMGEKPMVRLFGRPLIDYVTRALLDSSVERIFVAVTDNVPQTKQWALERELAV
ncbi:MAG: NTP transferase domain-containing protein, partial [Methanothrix sp.]|nr:NTP transferase domain-containing protein [Methanothrix sp.]